MNVFLDHFLVVTGFKSLPHSSSSDQRQGHPFKYSLHCQHYDIMIFFVVVVKWIVPAITETLHFDSYHSYYNKILSCTTSIWNYRYLRGLWYHVNATYLMAFYEALPWEKRALFGFWACCFSCSKREFRGGKRNRGNVLTSGCVH